MIHTDCLYISSSIKSIQYYLQQFVLQLLYIDTSIDLQFFFRFLQASDTHIIHTHTHNERQTGLNYLSTYCIIIQ